MAQVQKYHSSDNDYSQSKVASQWKRLVAELLDWTFFSILKNFIALLAIIPFYKTFAELIKFISEKRDPNLFLMEHPDFGMQILLFILTLSIIQFVAWYFLWIKPLKNFGQTFGKRLLKIRLVKKTRENERPSTLALIFRESLFKWITILSYIPGVFGFILFYSRSKFLHDYIFSTTVVEVKEKKITYISLDSKNIKSTLLPAFFYYNLCIFQSK